MDQTPDFLLLHSLGGGTGSGLGSRILEELRYNYPASYLAAACIAPSSAGALSFPRRCLRSILSFMVGQGPSRSAPAAHQQERRCGTPGCCTPAAWYLHVYCTRASPRPLLLTPRYMFGA
jgi:hypothetical protein